MDALRGSASALLLSLGALACAADDGPAATEIDFRIVTGADDDPWAGGSSLVVALEGPDQASLEQIEFPITATSGRAPAVPDGDGFRFRVDVLTADGFVLARGHSFPFSVLGGEASFAGERPALRPDVLVVPLGRFVMPLGVAGDLPPAERVAVLAAVDGGAVLATADGRLYEYVAHAYDATHDGEASLRQLAGGAREDATWAHLGDGLLLAVGGTHAGATLYERNGAAVATLDGSALGDQRAEVAVAAIPGARAALVIGGAPSAGAAPTDRITRVDATLTTEGWSLSATELSHRLVDARRDASALAVPVDDPSADCPCSRVLVVGGEGETGRLSSAEVVDPEDVDTPAAAPVGPATRDVALAVVDHGLALLAGGRGIDGRAVADVRTVDVRAGAAPQLVTPAPPPLATPRASAAAARFGNGLLLVVGGVGVDERPLASAELYDFEADRFGEEAVTGALPVAQGAPRATALDDGTVLVIDEPGVAVYAPPRGGDLSDAATGGAP